MEAGVQGARTDGNGGDAGVLDHVAVDRNRQRGQQADDQHDDEQFHEGEATLKVRVSSQDRLQTKKLLQGRI